MPSREAAEKTGSHRAPTPISKVRGANIQDAAAHNRNVIIRVLRTLHTAERGGLAEATGLTHPAIHKITKDLLREGVIISPSTRRGSKGQPAGILAVNPDHALSVGISVESENVNLVIVDFAGGIQSCSTFQKSRASLLELRSFFTKCINDFLDRRTIDLSKIVGVGFSAMHASIVLNDKVEIAVRELAALAGCSLQIASVASAAAHAEVSLDHTQVPSPFFFVTLSDQFDGVLVVDDQLVPGHRDLQNAPGLLPQLNPFRSSRTNLGKVLGEAVSISGFVAFLAERGVSIGCLDDIDLLDPIAREVIGEWIETVADLLYLPLLSMFCCLGLRAVLIGGPLPRQIKSDLSLALSKRLSLNLGMNWPDMAVRPAVLESTASAVGAALLAFGDHWEVGRQTPKAPVRRDQRAATYATIRER